MEASDNVEQQLETLSKFVGRINKVNDDLRRLVVNVEFSTSLIASVFRYYEIHNELLLTITSGPSVNLADYLIELDRLDDALQYFKHIEVIDEQKRVAELYNIGRQKLIEESNELIMRCANPILPEELLELCKSTSSTRIDTHNIQVSDLGAFRVIFDWFKEHGFQQGFIDSYATKRGTMIHSSLKLLAEYLRQKSVRRASINLLSVSPRASSRRSSFNSDMLKDQVKTTINEIGRRLARSPVFGRRDPALRHASLLPLKMDAHRDLLDVDNLSSSGHFTDDRETNNYKFLLDAFVILLLRDLDLLFYVFSNQLKSLVLTKLIELPLAYMHEEAQQLCADIRQLPHKIDTGKFAFFGLFSIIQWFHKSKPVLTNFYHESDLAPQYQFNSTLLPIFEHSSIECLRLILYEVRNDSSALTQGGHVHPLTLNVLNLMEGILDYEDMITAIQFSCTTENEITTDGVSSSVNKSVFNLSKYFTHLIRALRVNILKKVEISIPGQDRTIQAIFLLNNINYLLKRLENSSLLTMIESIEPNFKSKLEDYMQKRIEAYLKCYTPIIIPIQQMVNYDNLNHLSDTQLRECDRNQLKASFLTVNAAIDNLRHQHQEYIIDDVQLCDDLQMKSKQLVLDMFKTYYTKFAHKHFTANPEKYIQYNPSMLESIIDSFFER